MANTKPTRIQHSGVALYIDENQAKRIESFSADSSFKDEQILELANSGVAELISDLDTVGTSINAHDFGSIDNFAKLVNMYTTLDDNENLLLDDSRFDNAQVDFIIQVTSGTSTNALAASMWCGSQALTGFTMNFNADGNASESYTLEGDYKRWFLNAYRDTKVVSGTMLNPTTAKITGKTLQTGYTPLIVTVNNLIVADTAAGQTITCTDSGSDTNVTASPALSLASGDRIRLVYAKNVPASFSALSTTPAGLGALRRGMIDIYLFNPTSGTEEKVLRLQSVSINGSLDRSTEVELGTEKPYSRTLNRPISVEVTAEALMTDLEVFAKLANLESSYDAMTLNQISWDSLSSNTKLIVKEYKSETSHTAANLLRTIAITGLSVTSTNDNASVGDNTTVSFTLKSDNFLVSGSGVTPFL